MKLLNAGWEVNQQEEEENSDELLNDLAKDDGSVALKRAAEDREGWRHRRDVINLLYSSAED